MHTQKKSRAKKTQIAVRYVTLESLKIYDKNPRTITEEELEEIAKSIKKFNFIEPMIVRRKDKMIIAGHQRLQVAKILKIKKVPVVFVDCSDTDAKILNIALNKLGGHFDDELLLDVLQEIKLEGGEIELTGFDQHEIAVIESSISDRDNEPIVLSDMYQVLVECSDEDQQRKLFDHLKRKGYKCKVLTL